MPHSAKNQVQPSSSLSNTEDHHLQKTANQENASTSATYQKQLIFKPKTLTPQQVVGNCYEVIKQLETDSSITAYLVKDKQEQTNSLYVLELIYDGNSEVISKEVFDRQVTLIKKLSSHVQIPKLWDYLIENQQYYVVYEYTSGEMLASILNYRTLNEAEVINLLQDMARICDLVAKSQILKFQLLFGYILKLQSTHRYVLGHLKGLFLSQVTDVPLTEPQQLTLFHQQLNCLGKMTIKSLIEPKQILSNLVFTQTLPVNWQTQINLSPRLQTILAKMVAANGREHYNSLPEIAKDFKPLLRINQIVGNKYRLSRYLGEKNGIKTYLAYNIQEKQLDSSLLIVKQLTLEHGDRSNPELKLAHLKEEVQQLQALPSIKVIDLVREKFEEQEELYLVRNYIEGISLTKKFHQQKLFSPNEAISILQKALESLNVIHQQGLIHRNLKPSNLIMLAEEQKIVLVDFGLLQTLSENNQKIDRYSQKRKPPEQIVGRPTLSSDIYSLGIVTIEFLTGLSVQEIPQNLFQGKSLWQAKLASHQDLREIIERMVCSDVEKRYQSTEEVLQDLDRVKTDVLPLSKPSRNRQNKIQNKLWHLIQQPKTIFLAIAMTLGLLSSIEWFFPIIRPQYQVYRGQQLLSTQPVMALASFETALTLNPKKISAWQGKGEALLALQEYIPALEAYEQALSINRDRLASWQGKGTVLESLGEWQEALKAYNQALSLESNNIVSLAGKAKILTHLSRYQEALFLQEQALENETSVDVKLLSQAASNALALGKNNQALNILSRVQSIAPFQPYLWQNKIIALRNLAKPQEALETAKLILETYEQELEKKPQDIELWLGQAACFEELKRYGSALNAYRKAIAINSQDHRSWLGMSQVYLKMQQYEKANRAIEQAIAIKPQSFIAWHTRGLILQKRQDLAQAVASYDRAIALNQDFFPSWRDRSLVLISQNNYAKAVASLQKAVTLAPQDIESWLNLSQAYLGMQKIEEAKKAIDRVIFLQPRNSDYWLKKGFLWEQQQEYTKACDLYRQAMKIAPDLTIRKAMQTVGCKDEEG